MALTPVNILPSGRLVQMDLFETVAPDVKVGTKPPTVQTPRHGIVFFRPENNGLYRPMIETHPNIVHLKDWKETVYGISKHVIATLVEAGFVEGERVTPKSLLINLESWFAHRLRMREDPYFWTDHDNRRRYSNASSEVDRRRQTDHGKSVRKSQIQKEASGASTPVPAVMTPDTPQRGIARRGETAKRPD